MAERREKQNVVKEGECKMMGGLQENNNESRGRQYMTLSLPLSEVCVI